MLVGANHGPPGNYEAARSEALGVFIRSLVGLDRHAANRRSVLGNIYIDCSGDGDLAVWSGAPFGAGDDTGNMLYPSAMFRINNFEPA